MKQSAKKKGMASGSIQDLWVFGYASLMWRPGFAYEECRPARLYGWHRSLCVASVVYRGTAEAPGLVFGLRAGGACRGRAFRVAGEAAEAVRTYLRERELIMPVYVERMLGVHLLDASGASMRRVSALCFVADARHSHYRGGLGEAERREIVRRAAGVSGDNLSYVRNTMEQLRAMNALDRNLVRLWESL